MKIFYIDTDGKTALNLSDFEYQVLEAFPVEEGCASIVFRGKDGKKYLLSMDLDGNWLTEPALYDS